MEKFVPSKSAKGLFGDFNQLGFAMVGLILSVIGGFFGSFITNYYTERHWEREKRYELLAASNKDLYTIYNEVIKSISNRVYSMRIVATSFTRISNVASDDNKIGLSKSWDTYANVVGDWNLNRTRHQTMLEIYFGPEFKKEYLAMHSKMVTTGYKLSELKRNSISSLNKQLILDTHAELDSLDHMEQVFNVKMTSYMRNRSKSELTQLLTKF